MIERPLTSGGRSLMPIPFYYIENIDIADETLTYRVPINIENFVPSTPYAVRFYLFAANRLHRSTQDTFLI